MWRRFHDSQLSIQWRGSWSICHSDGLEALMYQSEGVQLKVHPVTTQKYHCIAQSGRSDVFLVHFKQTKEEGPRLQMLLDYFIWYPHTFRHWRWPDKKLQTIHQIPQLLELEENPVGWERITGASTDGNIWKTSLEESFSFLCLFSMMLSAFALIVNLKIFV